MKLSWNFHWSWKFQNKNPVRGKWAFSGTTQFHFLAKSVCCSFFSGKEAG